MSLTNPDLTKLSLKDERASINSVSEDKGDFRITNNAQLKKQNDTIGPIQETSEDTYITTRPFYSPQQFIASTTSTPTQKRSRGSPFSSFYNSVRSSRSGSPIPADSSAQTNSQATPQKIKLNTKSHIKQDTSSSSVSSQISNPSGHNSKASSVIELKRFFGKGRTKLEHGVVSLQDPKKSAFRFLGIGGRRSRRTLVSRSGSHSPLSNHESKTSSPSPLHEESSQKSKENSKKNKDDSLSFREEFRKLRLDLKGSKEDPNFVVHAPDYEADWDPFHVFGIAPNSERLPFLESGITKYGEVGKDMGSGAGGSVCMMARPSDNKLFAVKEFRARKQNETQQKYAKHVTAEYALGAALHHRNIIEIIDLVKEGDKYFEVMEYGPHDFFELVMSSSMTTAQINSSWKQIVSGVAYLHSMGVAHRDLKLDNCVVTKDGVVKLIDFGSAVVFKYPMTPQIHLARGIVGSDPYLAPEVFSKRPYQPQVADIWSCGIIYCCTYLRRFPWKIPQRDDPSFRKFSCNTSNVDGKHPPEENPRKITGPWRLLRLLPIDARDLIERIITIEVKKRITMDEILNSMWFQQIEEINILPPMVNGT